MVTNNRTKFPYFKTLLTSLGLFSINIAWAVYAIYVPVFLRNNLIPLLGEVKILNTLVGIIMVLDNIAALFLSPIMGNLSDRIWIRKLGRRLPFIIIGLPLGAMFFGLIGTFEGMFVLLLVAICGFTISMAVYDTAALSLIPDSLPEEHLSQGNGVLNIIAGLANITGLLVSARLYEINHALAFWVIGIIMIFCLFVLFLTVREKREIYKIENSEKVNLRQTVKQIFKDKNVTLILLLITVFMHYAGYQIAETFFSSYAEVFLGIEPDKAATILGVFLIIQIAFALPGGLLTKRIGTVNACILGVILFLLGFVPISVISMINIPLVGRIITLNNLVLTWEFFVFAFAILVMGFGWILLYMNLRLAIWNITPQGKTATYTAFYYVFSNFAAILSPLIAGGFFDLIGIITGIEEGLETYFLLIVSLYIIAFGLLIAIKARMNRLLHLDVKEQEKFEERIRAKDIPLRFLPLILFGVGIRQQETYKQLKTEQKSEQRQTKEQIKAIIADNPIKPLKRIIPDSETKVVLKQIQEQKQQQKETRKDYQQQVALLREEVLKDKLRNHLDKKSAKKIKNNKNNDTQED